MKKYGLLMLIFCLMAAGVRAQDETPEATPEPTVEATAEPTEEAAPEFPAPGSYTAQQRAGGLIRSYEIYLPQNFDINSDPVSLIIILHGAGGNGRGTEQFTAFDDLADQEGFIVVYPDSSRYGWNDNRGDLSGQVDDLIFMERIIDYFVENVNVDPQKVYVGGFSRGGMLAYRIGCQMRDKVSAVVSVASSMPQYLLEECEDAAPIPVMLIQGTFDNVILYDGMMGYLSADATIDYWVERNQCQTPADVTETIDEIAEDDTSVDVAIYNQCAEETEVVFYSVVSGGHNWPGHPISTTFDLGLTSFEIDANVVMWEFFQRH